MSLSDDVEALEDSLDEANDLIAELKEELEEAAVKEHYCTRCQALINLKK